MVPIVKKMEEWTKKSEKQKNKAQKQKQEVARGGSMTNVIEPPLSNMFSKTLFRKF